MPDSAIARLCKLVSRPLKLFHCHPERARRSAATECESKDPYSLGLNGPTRGVLPENPDFRTLRTPKEISGVFQTLTVLVRQIDPLLRQTGGSAILEFAFALPLLVVFVVGIYDFSGAFNQKQKVEQAAQEGAIVAAAQPTTDIYTGNGNPDTLQPVVAAVFNSLAGSGVLTQANQGGACTLVPPPVGKQTPSGSLTWIYTISGCSSASTSDNLVITINRGWTVSSGGQPATYAVGSVITVSYPYRWRFNSVIQVLIPGAKYAAVTNVTESATVHNQM